MNSSHWVALAAFMLLSVSVVCDLRTRTIPDSISIALALLGITASMLRWHDLEWVQVGGGVGAAFAIGAALFYLGAMGGGDAKLCAGIGAVCGWFPDAPSCYHMSPSRLFCVHIRIFVNM